MATYSRLFLILISLWGFANAMFRPANYLDAQLAMLLPSQIRLIINGYARDHSTSINDSSVSHYEFRLQWVEPYKWGDEDSGFDLVKKRRYEIHCWMETDGGKHVRDLLNSTVPYRLSFQEYVERRVEISDIDEFADDFYVQCGIRVRNALDARTVYSYSNTIRMRQVPVYFRGYEGLNLRAFSIDDFLTLKKNTEILLGDEELAEEEETRRKLEDGGKNGTDVGNKSIDVERMWNGSHWEISNGTGRTVSNETAQEISTAQENVNSTVRTILNSTERTSTNPSNDVFSNSTKATSVRLDSTSTDFGRLISTNSTHRVISNSTDHRLLNATDHGLLNSTDSRTLNSTSRGLLESIDRGFSNATKGNLHSATKRPILNSTARENLNSTQHTLWSSTTPGTSPDSGSSIRPSTNHAQSTPSISTSTSTASSHEPISNTSISTAARSPEALSELPTISSSAISTTQPATNATMNFSSTTIDSTLSFENSTTQSDDRYNATATPPDSTNAPSFAAHEILSKMVKSAKESFRGTFYGLRAMREGFRRAGNGTVSGMTNGTVYG